MSEKERTDPLFAARVNSPLPLVTAPLPVWPMLMETFGMGVPALSTTLPLRGMVWAEAKKEKRIHEYSNRCRLKRGVFIFISNRF